MISFQYEKSQIGSFALCPSIDRCLDRLKLRENYRLAVGGSRQRILNSRFYSPSKIYCFGHAENIASYQSVLLMRKDFALIGKIDKIIRNAFECGLLVKWDRDSQRKKERIDPFEPKYALTLEQYVVFLVVIYSIGCIWAILSFFAEIIIKRKMKQRKRSPIWKYLERFFDGNRYYFKNLLEKLIRK